MSLEVAPDYVAMHRTFAESEYGQILATRVRFGIYTNGLSNDRWQELLGADVNNLHHMQVTHRLARAAVDGFNEHHPGLLSPYQGEVIKCAGQIHDQAEAVVSDKNFYDVTPEHKEFERRVLTDIINEQHKDAPENIKKLLNDAIEVSMNPDSKLGVIFNIVEGAGYLRTALRAADKLRQGLADDCQDSLMLMVASVITENTNMLISRAQEYIPVRNYLLDQAARISAAYQLIDLEETFSQLPEEERLAMSRKFVDCYYEWELWQLVNTSAPELTTI